MKLPVVLFLLVFLLSLPTIHASPVINEIMYNPDETDDYNEWVEVYNPSDSVMNIENWTLCNDTILMGYVNKSSSVLLETTFEIPADGFALITDGGTGTEVYDNFNVSENATAFHVDKNTICNGGLTNDEKYIAIKNSTLHEIDSVNYSSSWGGNGNGNDICLINDTFQECEPTPGSANILYDVTNETEENETEDLSNITCDLSLEITTDKLVYENEQIKYSFYISDTECNDTEHEINITYWAEDLFGNIVKDAVTVEKTMPCYYNFNTTWTPSDILGSEGYNIKADITDTGCNDTNISNNLFTKTIIFRGTGHPDESSIRITDVNSGNSAGFGESITVKAEIYKNTTNMYAIYARVENSGGTELSETATVHIKSKNTLYNFTIPIQLKHNCNNEYSDGNHIVVVEGLGLRETDDIAISGNANGVCHTEYISSGGSSGGGGGCFCPECEEQTCPIKTPDYEILTYENKVEIYEEFNTKVKLEAGSKKNISVYSYVFDGNKLLSYGLNNGVWGSEWDSNKQEFEVKDPVVLVLKNKIKENTNPGTYTLRVRVNDGTKYDMDRDIEVVEEIKEEKEEIATTARSTEDTTMNETENKSDIITGYAIAEKEEKEFKPSQTMLTIYMIYIKLLSSKSIETQQTNQTNVTD